MSCANRVPNCAVGWPARSTARPVKFRQWCGRDGVQRIAARFDPENGGNAGAPKFPHAGELELLLECATDSPLPKSSDEQALTENDCAAMAMLTLRSMAARGLQDHLGGGFFRYCVDARWTIPHFEKMLYDNAQLLPLYAEAAATFGDPACAQAAGGIAEWLQREMTAGNGAFFSALDADSKGTKAVLKKALSISGRASNCAIPEEGEFATIEAGYGLDGEPNFEDQAWHLVKSRTLEQIAQQLGRSRIR